MKKIKNNKGFTLAELLATVVIIGILSTVAIVTVSNVTKKSHKEYDEKQNKLFTVAAQTYFTDNRSRLPKKLLTEKQVTLEDLIKENYIDEIVDYKKEPYNKELSIAYVKKTGRGRYRYYSKLVGRDGKIRVSDKEDNKKSDIISVVIDTYDTFETDMHEMVNGVYYVNKKLKIRVSGSSIGGDGISSYQYKIMRLNKENHSTQKKYKSSSEIAVDDKSFTDTITIDAKDFANGIYKLALYAYGYNNEMGSAESFTIVIDKTKPKCTIEMDREPDGLQVENSPENKWYKAGSLSANMTIKEKNKYEYGLGLDSNPNYILGTNDNETLSIEKNIVNGYVYGIVRDKAGNEGKCKTNKPIYYDNTSPTCKIELSGGDYHADTGWYWEDVTLNLKSFDELEAPDESGVGDAELTTNATHEFPISVPPIYTNNTIGSQGETSGQMWYGYVKDKAGNEGKCKTDNPDGSDAPIKVDKTPPTCTVNIAGQKGNVYDGKQWYINNNPTASLNVTENTSGLQINSISMSGYVENGEANMTLVHDNEGYLYGTVKDGAGRSGYCVSEYIAVDTKKPSCDWDGESKTWTNSDRKITLSCGSDEGSGCSGSEFWSKTYSTDTKTDSQSHEISDYAGNKNTCSKTTLNVYVDKTHPNITITHDANAITITATCTDAGGSGKENFDKITENSHSANDCGSTTDKICHKYTDCLTDNTKATQFSCTDKAGNKTIAYKYLTCTCNSNSTGLAKCNNSKDTEGNAITGWVQEHY